MSAALAGMALAAVSAIGSLSAHAVLKSGDDKFAIQAWTSLLGLLALPLVVWVGWPQPDLIPWLLTGWVLHTIYYLVLIRSYNISDYSLAYPIARGVVPIGTTVLGMLWLGDQLSLIAVGGVVTICAGILLLSARGARSRAGMGLAIVTGLINMAFTLVDAQGLRIAVDPLNFLVWYFILDGIAMPLLFVLHNRGRVHDAAMASVRHGLLAGVLSLIAYIPALIAYRLAPVGAVSAIRATSVLLSMGFGGGLLREAVDARRITGALLVTGGAYAVIVGSQM